MIRFYAPDLENTPLLPPEESGHAVRVLRKRPGDTIEVVDGRGNLHTAVLLNDNHKGAAIEIRSTTPLPKVWKPDLTIAVAPTKNNDRMEWLVEKLVEIGVDRIVPLRCARSERKDIKTERLQRIAISAMKQSLKAILPRIDSTTTLKDFLAQAPEGARVVGYCDASCPRRLLSHHITAGDNLTVLIGPEGDFTPEEIEMCLAAGFVPVTMGDNRLRTETAALVAADTFHIINQLAQS